jgi:hypothetical protein
MRSERRGSKANSDPRILCRCKRHVCHIQKENTISTRKIYYYGHTILNNCSCFYRYLSSHFIDFFWIPAELGTSSKVQFPIYLLKQKTTSSSRTSSSSEAQSHPARSSIRFLYPYHLVIIKHFIDLFFTTTIMMMLTGTVDISSSQHASACQIDTEPS